MCIYSYLKEANAADKASWNLTVSLLFCPDEKMPPRPNPERWPFPPGLGLIAPHSQPLITRGNSKFELTRDTF